MTILVHEKKHTNKTKIWKKTSQKHNTDRQTQVEKNYKFLFEFSRYYYIKNGAILIYQLGLLYKIVILDNLEIIN